MTSILVVQCLMCVAMLTHSWLAHNKDRIDRARYEHLVVAIAALRLEVQELSAPEAYMRGLQGKTHREGRN